MQFVLASGSPRRRELLASLGIDFTVIKSDIDETQQVGEDPYAYVRRLSIEKAAAVTALLTEPSLVLAADTVVILATDTIGVTGSGEILGKPADANEARDMLRRLRGRDHIVCTALTLQRLELQAQRTITQLTRTTVIMRDYSDAEIDAYIATGDPFDKAGGYAIQHDGFHPVERIDGSYSNVVGLPVETLRRMLVALRDPDLHFRMPIEEFLGLPETNLPAELIDGLVYARGANMEPHQRVLGDTLFLLGDLRENGELLPGPIGICLDELNVVQPDIVWISPRRSQIIEEAMLRGAPDLVIEVLSPSTALRDKQAKFRLYEKHGVREYWIVEPTARYVEVWCHGGEAFALHGVFGTGDTFTSAVLGQKAVEVSAIFGA